MRQENADHELEPWRTWRNDPWLQPGRGRLNDHGARPAYPSRHDALAAARTEDD